MPVAWDEFVPVQDKPKDKSFDWSEFSPIDSAAPVPGVPSPAEQEQIRRLPRPEELATYGGPPKPVASLAETIAEPSQMAFEPKVTVPRLPIKEGESKLLTVGKEAVNILAGIPEFLSSPAGVVSTVVAPAAPLTVGTVFTAAMLKDLASQVQDSYKNWDQMSGTQKTKAITDMVGTGTFAGLPWLKPAVRALRSKTTPTPEVSDASKVQETAAVYGDVRPQPEQGVREVPVQESGAGVQPQAPQGEVPLKPTVTETTPPVPESEMPKTPSETGLYPAVREVGGKVDVAEAGTTHPQIIKEEGLKAEDIDQRGFVDEAGKFKDREQAAAQSGVPTEREPGRQHSTDLPEAQETFAQREARLFHESQLRQSVPAAELPKPTTKLPDLVKKLGRNEVNALLGEWEDGAELSADGKYIKSWSDPRNPTSKSRVPAAEFLSWYEQKAKAPTPVDVPPGQSALTKGPPEKVAPTAEAVKRIARGYGGIRKFNAETESFGPDILSWINENMKLLSKSSAKATWGKEKFQLNKSLYDDAVKLNSPHHNVIYSDKGFAPDRVAQAAFEAGVLKEPSVNELWKAIERSSKARAKAFATGKREAKFLEEEAKAHEDWLKATAKGETRISGGELKVGDLMEVDGERTEVTHIDPDTGDVTLKDGRKFGTQVIGENKTIHVEKFQPSEEGSFEPEPEIRGMGGAVLSEFDQPHSIVSNMFAAIDRDRAAMGKPPMELGRRRSWDEDNARALSRMNHDPAWIPDLIREVLAKPRPLLSWENAGLVWHRAKLTAELNNSLQRIAQAFDGGVKETLAEAKLDAARFEDELEMLDRAVGRGGTGSEAGRSLQAQKMGAGDDFTLVEMRLRKRAAVGGRPLTDAESAEIKTLHDQLNAQKAEYEKSLADKDRRIAEQEVKLALDRIALEAKRQPDVPPHVRIIADRVKTYFDTRAEAALKRLSGKLFTLSPQVLADLTDLGVSRILSGAIEFGEWSVKMAEAVGERVKPHLKTVWDSAQSALNKHIEQVSGPKPVAERVKRVVSGREVKDNREKIVKGIAEKVSAGKRGEITALVQKLARYFVQEGVTERNALIDAVHNELSAIDPEFTRRQTMDAISGYGDFKQLRKDEISKQLRDLKGQMQQVAKLEDMQAGQPPLKTGVERRIPSKEESRLIKLVNEAKRQFQVPISDPSTQLRSSLDELKKRMATRMDELNEKMRTGDFSRRPRREIVLDSEAQQLKAQYERTKLKFERMITQDRLRQRSWPEKAMDTFVKWRRGFVLSSPITLGKLTTAAAQRLSFTPLEEAVGAGIGRIIPDVAEKAPREGGWNTRAEAAALSGGFTKGMKDAWDTLRTGQSDLDVLHGGKFDPAVGEGLVLDRSVVDYIGQSHGMLKAPVKRAEFERSLRKRIDYAIRTGQDMTDPLVMMRAATEAYKDGNRAIFLQDNAVVSAYKRALSAFEQRSKETGKVPLERKAVAATARVLLPIVKVPTNIVAETLTYSTGLFTGGARLGRALYKGVASLKPEEADLIMRQLKKGSIGGAMLITGYLLPDYIGGYYQHGVKRDKRDVKPGAIRVGNVNLPYWMLHNPLLNTLQLGATIRRVADSKLSKKDREAQGLTAGVVAGGLGLTEETPFVREMLELTKAWNPHDRSAFFGELAKGIAVPQALQWAAKTYDVDSQGNIIERKPKTALEHIKMGVPGLREQVQPKP